MKEEEYKAEALQLNRKDLSPVPKSVGWESPSNIALIKYWGKKQGQTPINPSLSMTLSMVNTKTEIHYAKSRNNKGTISFRYNGEENQPFEERVTGYLKKISVYFPFLEDMDLFIYSRNNFPHSAGVASSASALSSLALCICSMEERLKEEKPDKERFIQKASFMARLGSGSASRSVYGNYVEWGAHTGGSDEFASPLNDKVDEQMAMLHDSILITSSRPKKISSSEGHALMENHPYQKARIIQATENFDKLKKALKEGLFNTFTEIVETEALSIHGLLFSSDPGYILLNGSSIRIMELVREFREKKGIPVAFTLDAGPNVHLLYPTRVKEDVREFIDKELIRHCENGRILHDFTGKGPEQLDKNQNL